MSISKSSAIYRIRCIFNNKPYVGSAVNAYSRWHSHLTLLRKNKHHSILLQRAWNKYGEEAFKFEIIELVQDKNKLIEREQYWIDFYDAANKNRGYNISPIAGSQLGYHHTEETKKNHSLHHTGYRHTEEAKRKISEAGHRPCSPETAIKISLAQKDKPRPFSSILKMRGRKFTEEHKQKLRLAKLGKPSGRKGMKLDEEWRKNLSIAHLGQICWKKDIWKQRYSLQEVIDIYMKSSSLFDCSKKLKISFYTLSRILVEAGIIKNGRNGTGTK